MAVNNNHESFDGTSPRAWGNLPVEAREAFLGRNIPTGVGKTIKADGSLDDNAEHPHGRGENFKISGGNLVTTGTSPRAWGKLPGELVDFPDRRNIPTGVGKTTASSPRPCGGSEHPHGRGENKPRPKTLNTKVGTSPRAWGKHAEQIETLLTRRNIPTGVGKTQWLKAP